MYYIATILYVHDLSSSYNWNKRPNRNAWLGFCSRIHMKRFLMLQHLFLFLDITECLPTTCSGNGECKERLGGGTICICSPGWAGSNCSKYIDFCDPNPCAFKSNCTSIPGSFYCTCSEGFQGKYCSEGITDLNYVAKWKLIVVNFSL